MPHEQTVDLAPFTREANVRADSFDDEALTVDLVFTTGVAVRRFSYAMGGEFLETLRVAPDAMRLERFRGGIPLLDSHSKNEYGGTQLSVRRQYGKVDDPRIENGKGIARARFSRRKDDTVLAGIVQDVRDKIIDKTSVGYIVHRYEEVTAPAGQKAAPGSLRTFEAVDWEPHEVSLTPIPADADASIRGKRGAELPITNRCAVLTETGIPMAPNPTPETQRALPLDPTPPETTPAVETIEPAPAARSQPAPVAVAPAAPVLDRDALLEEGRVAERARTTAIRELASTAQVPEAFTRGLIDEGVSAEVAQTRILAQWHADQTPEESGNQVRIDVGDEARTKRSGAVERAMLARFDRTRYPLEDADDASDFVGLSLIETGRNLLESQGVAGARGMSAPDVCDLLLQNRAGGHSTSDFPLILANVANKTLTDGFKDAPATYDPLVSRRTVKDFKPIQSTKLGEGTDLAEVSESGEYHEGTIGESAETYQIRKFGRILTITEETLLNDDLRALTRIPQLLGRRAASNRSDIVWAIFVANPAMADGTAVWHADHNNLAASGGAIAIATLAAGTTAMRRQVGLDGGVIEVAPSYLVVPPELELVAFQNVVAVTQNVVAGEANPYTGRLTPIVEARLTDAGAWYLSAATGDMDIIELAELAGRQGPQITTQLGFDVDGMRIKIKDYCAAKALEHRGLYKNAGA